MKFAKNAGLLAGKISGKVLGGVTRAVGELAGSAYLKEIGDSVEKVTENTGRIVGEAVSGVLDVGAGILMQDPVRRNAGFQDIGSAIFSTARGVWDGVGFVFENGKRVAQGLYYGDTGRLKEGLKHLGKAAVVGTIAVGVIDLAGADPAAAADSPGVYSDTAAPLDMDTLTPALDGADPGHVTHMDTINAALEGELHPETGVPYESKIVQLAGDEYIQGVFPDFEEVYAGTIPESMYMESDCVQFSYMNEQLAEQIARDPALASAFTETQISQIMEGETPDGYVWHHSEEPGRLELVSEDEHAKSAHTGGRAIWGGGSEYR